MSIILEIQKISSYSKPTLFYSQQRDRRITDSLVPQPNIYKLMPYKFSFETLRCWTD